MSLLASVVVPVYNPGPAIGPCIDSLLAQSLPADRYEVIFVDDGSTDGTAARLDEVAAQASNVRVIHIPPSGAPGRPRNIGLAQARGEYVHFVDADDILAPRALEWLTEMADRHGSDVVMGKYASASLDRSQVVFTHSRARASLASTPELLTASWAPAKLFRTSMLRQHGITFAEGWRWMEDQLFVLQSYLAARNVSIYADAPCYFFVKREEGGHLSAETLAPEPHVEHLGEVFDVIEATTEPGPFRERLVRRFYRANLVTRLDSRYLPEDETLRDRTFAAFHGFATSRVPEAIDSPFGGATRVRARMLRAGDAAKLFAFNARLDAHELQAELTNLRWRDGRLVFGIRGQLRDRDTGAPLPYLVRGGRTWLDPDLADGAGELVDAEVESTMGRFSLIEPRTALEWLVPGPFAAVVTEVGGHPAGGRRAHVAVLASVEIDPLRIGPAGNPLTDGSWSAIFRWSGMGISRSATLRPGDGHATLDVLPAAFADPLRLAAPRIGADGLALDVTTTDMRRDDWRAPWTSVIRQGRTIEVELPIVAGRGAGTGSAEILLRSPGDDRSWPAEIGPHLGRMHLRSIGRGFGARPVRTDEATLHARLGPPFDLEVEIGRARLDGSGAIRIAGAADRGPLERTGRRLTWVGRSAVGRTRGRLRQGAIDVAVRLPDPLRRVVVGAYRRIRGRRG